MIKAIKLSIIKPLNIDYDSFGFLRKNGILSILSEENQKILNGALFECHKWAYEAKEYKERFGVWPNYAEFHNGYKIESGYILNIIKEKYSYSQSANVATAVQKATKLYAQWKKDIFNGNVSIPSFSKNSPIFLHGDSIKVVEKDKSSGNYVLALSLLNEDKKADYKLGRRERIRVMVSTKKGIGHEILDRCLTGEYKVCASSIELDKKKKVAYLLLSYDFTPETPELDDDHVMGIDLGMKLPAVMAFNFDDKKYVAIDDNRILEHKTRLAKNLSIAQHQSQWHCDGNSGHGRKKKVGVYENYANKSHNMSMTINHQWSKYIVDTAVKNKCGVIQMEDLSGIKASRQNFLGNWTYYDLQQKITYKAEENGIKVIKVDPSYTSQMCPVCGYINKRNRSTQADFECLECGHIANADYNAARNIATPDIANIIKNRLTQQKKEGKPIE